MSVIKVTTETGSVYKIDLGNRLWSKNGMPAENLRRMAIGEWDGNARNIPNFHEWAQVAMPEVGTNMYIEGNALHGWYLTTKIVSVEEIDGLWEMATSQ